MQTKRVVVMVGSEGAFGRNAALGIRSFARGRLPWVFQFHQPTIASIQGVLEWEAEGVITEIWSQEMAEAIQQLNRPTVDLSNWGIGVPIAAVDSRAAGRVGAEYFLDRNYRHLGYAALEDAPFAQKRRQAFTTRAEEAGLVAHIFQRPYLGDSGRAMSGWGAVDQALKSWLLALPKPVGILADNDGKALQLMEAARQAGSDIPEQVAVLGIDNDEVLCELAQPPLSSVAMPANRVGYEAAALLEQLMAGKKPKAPVVLLSPIGVVTRQSSDVSAIEDADLAAIVKFIRVNAHRPFKLAEALDTLALSRRSLERRFKKTLGRTLLDEVNRVHVEQARQLLTLTDLTMRQVAERSGFSNIRRLAIVFK